MEGIPVVLMEAMAAGVPVVATRVGGVPELVEDEVSGLLVRPGSAEDLAAALARVCADPRSAAQRTIAARARIERDFDLRRSAEAMRELFRRYTADDGG
jgi:glycosyltransferase involved in cell wall biosynthesis